MDKNYYEILEVDRNASPEIIEKAYKTLAKKYHPDLQNEFHKKEAEETFKIINEAYQTLSDPEQRALYDQKIKNTVISQDKYNEMYQQNQILKDKLNDLQQHMYYENNYSNNAHIRNSANTHYNTTKDNTQNINFNSVQNNEQNSDYKIQAEQYQIDLEYEKQMNQARQQAYHDAYIQDLKNRGYKIKYKKTFSDYIKDLIAFIIFIAILLLLLQIPFVRDFFIDIYNNNPLIQLFVNIFKNKS